jgi:predicted RNase H-like HicB family nuclease
MVQNVTLEYWKDKDWYVGRLRGVPGVFSQGRSLEELETSIVDAYRLMLNDDMSPVAEDAAEAASYVVHTKEIGVQV